MGIEFAHSIFRLCNPAVLSLGEAIQEDQEDQCKKIKHDLAYEE